jgi:hypothetical protein
MSASSNLILIHHRLQYSTFAIATMNIKISILALNN